MPCRTRRRLRWCWRLNGVVQTLVPFDQRAIRCKCRRLLPAPLRFLAVQSSSTLERQSVIHGLPLRSVASVPDGIPSCFGGRLTSFGLHSGHPWPAFRLHPCPDRPFAATIHESPCLTAFSSVARSGVTARGRSDVRHRFEAVLAVAGMETRSPLLIGTSTEVPTAW